MTFKNSDTIRIIIVDDHRSFIDGLAMVIDSQSPLMEIVGTASDFETLQTLLPLKPDVILLDVDLGAENSLSFLRELAEKTKAKILMITGLQDKELHKEAILKGARGVLLKNESARTILNAIKKVYAGEIWLDQATLGKVLDKFNSDSSSQTAALTDEMKLHAQLTPREREIINALVVFEASTNKEIAENLCISTSTLKNHLTTIFDKLAVKNRVHLIKYALTHKLIDMPK